MKKLTIFFIVFFCTTISFSQTVYYDAIYLTRFIKESSDGKLSLGPNNNTDNIVEQRLIEEQKLLIELKKLLTDKKNSLPKDKKWPKQDSIKLDSILRILPSIDKNLSELNSIERDTIFNILKRYFPLTNDMKNDKVNEIIHSNTILKNLSCDGIGKETNPINNVSLPNIMNSIGGLDVTNIADGLAKFLVKRTKEELNVAFFSKFKDVLQKSEYRDLQILFPNTWELLDAIGDQIYDYKKYIQNLREAFQIDIKALDVNLPGIIPSHSDFFEKHFELAASLNTACYITRSLKNQVHPADIIDQYPLNEYFIKKNQTDYFNKNWSGAIQTLQLISGSLRTSSKDKERYWVDFKSIKEMLNNKIAFQIYLGLIYQVAKNERYNSIHYEKGTLIDILNKVDFNKDYDNYKNYISNFALKVNDLNEMLINYSKPRNDSIAIENYTRFFKSSVELIEYCTLVSDLPHFKDVVGDIKFRDELKPYFKITYETSDLALDINRRNYSSAVNHAVTIYNLVRTKVVEKDLTNEKDKLATKTISCKQKKTLRKYIRTIGKLDKLAGVPINTDLKTKINDHINSTIKATADQSLIIGKHEDSVKKSSELLKKLTLYGTFMSTIATAKNSDEVEQAIESAALPSGSSRIKRETPFNVSLNAYCGMYAGYERIKGLDRPLSWTYQKINSYGVSAPIGISISTGGHNFAFLCPSHEGHWSYSAFISIIDIGAIASFRFKDSESKSDSGSVSVSQIPKIQLKDIVSPGLFLSFGLPKCPLSVNIGAQLGPNLREVNQATDDKGNKVNLYQNNVYWRYSVSLVVDIPIFNFYTKSKK